MSTCTGNELIAAINDGSILESGVGSSLNIEHCTDQQLATIIDYLVEHDLASNLTELDLSFNHLTSLPDSFGNLKNLTELFLHENKLTSLPDSFGNLKNLTELFLHENKLTNLPDSFGNLKNLTALVLYKNQLTSLPDSFGNLKNLTDLFLNENKLTSLPDSFGNLKNLTKLSLRQNQLTSLPDSFGNLKNLTKLFLHENKLTSLPNSFGNLKNLTELFLHDNKLNSLPDSLGHLSDTAEVYLKNNPLETLPILAHDWQNKGFDSKHFTTLQKQLQGEVRRFSDILTGLMTCYIDLKDDLTYNPDCYDKAQLEQLRAMCRSFYCIFLMPNPTMSFNIIRHALKNPNVNAEPQFTANEYRFERFFQEERDKMLTEYDEPSNPVGELESIKIPEKQPINIPSVMRFSFSQSGIAVNMILLILATLVAEQYYGNPLSHNTIEPAIDPAKMMNGY